VGEEMKEEDIRSEVKDFSVEMEKILSDNDYKGHWSNEGSDYLSEKLKEEVKELFEALEGYDCNKHIRKYSKNELKNIKKEAVDVANVAMMIWDNTRNMGKDWL
jgi:NTP pyrophosphatase (non-canonical NTP hydrolase)